MTKSIAQAMRPVRVVWDLWTDASIDDAWEAFADTDRFNRVANLGFQFIEDPRPDGTIHRTGKARRLGMMLTWDDLPFQYQAPEWFRKVRRFHNGPAAEMVNLVRLRPERGGTAIRYSFEVYPRFSILRPLVALEVYAFTRPALDRTLNKLLGLLAGQREAYDRRPPPLSLEARELLKQGIGRIQPQKFGTALQHFLLNAPLQDQDRILPLRLARRWDVPDRVALEGFLTAVREGLLTLRWDVLCPSCRAPKQRADQWVELAREVHCASCNIQFDGTFPDSLEVSFRPAQALRTFEVTVACMGSPGRQPHIAAQDRLEPGAEVELAVPLTAGLYRIRSWPPREKASLEVRADALADRLTVVAGPFAFDPARSDLSPGRGVVTVRNVTDRVMDVVLEQLWRPTDLLTAGQLMESPGLRALVPDGILPPSFEAEGLRAAVLVVEVLRGGPEAVNKIYEQLRGSSPRRLHRADDRIIASFNVPSQACAQLRGLFSPDLRAVLTMGPLLEVSLSGGIVPMGAVMDEAMAILRTTAAGIPVLPASVARLPEIRAALEAQGATLVTPAAQAPDTPPSLQVQLSRS